MLSAKKKKKKAVKNICNWNVTDKIIKEKEEVGKVSERSLISVQITSSIKYCSNRADTRLARWSLVSPIIYSLRVCLCVYFVWVATIYSAGIRVWAWKNKTLTSKQRWADVVWPEAAAALCYYSMCVCLLMEGAPLQTGGGTSTLGPSSETHSLRPVIACQCFCTHKNTYLSYVSVIYVCAVPEPVNYKGLAVDWRTLVCCLSPQQFG